MYTEELVKKAYIDIMKTIDENVWCQLAQRKKHGNIKSLMEEAKRLMIIKLHGKESAVLDTQSLNAIEVTGLKDPGESSDLPGDLGVSELVQAMEKLDIPADTALATQIPENLQKISKRNQWSLSA
ncbi:hypothetical protein AYI69_g2491 [Smittium culicis]|uniref:Uncharacterized protein n=1 Tax=Smittium culicis TaxID=133412 RepID=A0A1R1YMR5_9FUNG|nr:hypothetical protein AYI69_g2491 [Smittium culicis]